MNPPQSLPSADRRGSSLPAQARRLSFSPAPSTSGFPRMPKSKSSTVNPMTFHTDIFQETPANTGAWRGLYFDGSQSDQNHEGDEIPVWTVYVGDEQAEPTGTVYKFHSFNPAEELAKRMSQDRRLELIHE